MKKAVSILLTVILLLSLTACGDSLEAAEVIEVNTAQDSETYVFGEDFQQNWNYWGNASAWTFTEIESGFYYYEDWDANLLRFFDFDADADVVLCNQPNCQHNNGECNAVFDTDIDYFQFYNGYLYCIKNDGAGLSEISVYRISADGCTHGKVGVVFTKLDDNAFRAVVHRGYVYCSMTATDAEERATGFYRFSLSGEQAGELVYTFDSHFLGSTYLTAYGNYVYVQLTYFEDGEGNGYNGDLYRYNIHTGEMELVLENMRRDFRVDSRHVYYDNDTQVIAYDLETGEETVLLDVGYPVYLMMDEEYIYCDNTCGQWITYYGVGELPEGDRVITVIDKATFEIAAAVVWEKDFKARLIGAVNGWLIGENGSQFYRYDLDDALAGGEVIWEEMN